jgi:hypothetical protein
MNKKGTNEHLLAYSTVALAIFTAIMAFQTWNMAKESKDASYRQIGVQTWLEFEKRFDSREMLKARKVLALELKNKTMRQSDDNADTVSDFFEDLGTVYKGGLIDPKLANSSFGYFATRYWEAMRPFVDEDRRKSGGDKSLDEDFEFLGSAMIHPNDKLDENDLQSFLADESDIRLP